MNNNRTTIYDLEMLKDKAETISDGFSGRDLTEEEAAKAIEYAMSASTELNLIASHAAEKLGIELSRKSREAVV